MHTTEKETGRPINKKNAQDLYTKYMTLALETRTKGDRALFENYYQHAEYYLHLMNELDRKLSVTPTPIAEPLRQIKILPSPFPLRSGFLRRNRRSGQHKALKPCSSKSSFK
ncbi:MAG: hypothetical protein K0R52_1004 [Alphaproteobacteria bacterium]|jgi:hypothetical protein|nr:hypothetical protein [Alphaproteobacteria bacterium]